MMRIGVLAVNNIFVEETTNELSDHFYIDAIILKKKTEQCKVNQNHKIKLRFINKKSVIDLLKLPIHIKRVEKRVDGFIVHYINPYFAILLACGIVKKPIAYFCYGGDIQKTGITRWLVKHALKKIDLICVEFRTQQIFIQEKYNIPEEKIISSVVIWNVNHCFKEFSDEIIKRMGAKWKLTKKYIIFSPRTVSEVYNHHLLIEGLNLMDEQFKKEIQVVIISGGGSEKYRNKIIDLANKCNVEIVDLGKKLTPIEMAEIYNIALINLNIPKHDQFGKSIMEGCICGAIPLLNMEIPTYHELCEDEINCIFVKPQPQNIAEKIEYIINNSKKLKNKFYLKNSKTFKNRLNHKENVEEFAKVLRMLVHNMNK